MTQERIAELFGVQLVPFWNILPLTAKIMGTTGDMNKSLSGLRRPRDLLLHGLTSAR
jgi:hypothetical protein